MKNFNIELATAIINEIAVEGSVAEVISEMNDAIENGYSEQFGDNIRKFVQSIVNELDLNKTEEQFKLNKAEFIIAGVDYGTFAEYQTLVM